MEFDWDEGNRDKNLRLHGVHDWEIEEAFEDRHRHVESTRSEAGERRQLLLGRSRTSGKYLRIIYTVRVDQEEDSSDPLVRWKCRATRETGTGDEEI